VFSATLSKDLQQNLKKRWRHRGFQKNNKASTLDDLLSRLDFRDAEPEINDLSPKGGVVPTLKESRIECLATDKVRVLCSTCLSASHRSQDVYLYYFLLRYPGRTLVFLSSIDGIRRLAPLLELLGLPTFPLHSQLEQRQRLKNLDRCVPRRCLMLLVVSKHWSSSASSHMHTLSSSRLILLPVGSTSHWYLMSFIIKFREP
jgi:ATP-dependent RNA helicase DDX24/MAK5